MCLSFFRKIHKVIRVSYTSLFDTLPQKLIIDEKKYYLFGRNPDLCDFTIDHQSCSRVHAALVYHKHLKRVFLIDLNSSK